MSDTSDQFLPIWKIPDHLKCPVAGAMLSVEKHRSILKKCGYDVKSMKPYEYQQKIMLQPGGENHVSQKVNNFIRNQSARQLETLTERLDREKVKMTEKTRALKEMSKKRKADAGVIGNLETRNRQLTLKVQQLRTDHPGSARNDAENPKSEEQIQALTRELRREKKAHQALMRKHKALQIELFSHQSELELIKKEFQSLISGARPSGPSPCSHPAENTAGGEFHYHDGYMKNANAGLEAKVKRCDLVLCPVNCNSHTACRKVKQLCSRYNKPLKILSSTSLSAVTQALIQTEKGITLN